MHERRLTTIGLSWDLTFSCKLVTALMIGLLFSLNSFALDVDSKLTLRILKTSISKKTILINRGLEDGLVVGDHAKFFLTDGVVARGLVIKASPSRSVWSLYRVIRIEEIRDQKVVNLKISTPVKVTADPTKSLNSSPIIAGREVMVERSDGQIDLKIDGNSNADKEEMKTLYGREVVSHKTYADGTMELDKTWDIILSMGTQSLAVSDPNAVDSTTEATQGSILMGIGLEKYFPKLELDFARKFSFLMFMNKSSFAVEAVDLSVTGTSMDFGIGSYYHFLNYPYAVNKFIMFVGGAMGLGSDTLESQTSVVSTSLSGTANFFSAAGGVKYLKSSGLGFRLMAEFVQRGITFKAESSSVVNITQTEKGLRFLAGLSYRW